jgi:hypothetical protein
MKLVERPFIHDKKIDHHAGRNPDGQAEYFDERKTFMSEDIPNSADEITLKHLAAISHKQKAYQGDGQGGMSYGQSIAVHFRTIPVRQ